MIDSLENNIKILRGPDHLKIYIFESGEPDDPNDPEFRDDIKNLEMTLSEWDAYRLAMTLLKTIGFEVGEDEFHNQVQVKYKLLHNSIGISIS